MPQSDNPLAVTQDERMTLVFWSVGTLGLLVIFATVAVALRRR